MHDIQQDARRVNQCTARAVPAAAYCYDLQNACLHMRMHSCMHACMCVCVCVCVCVWSGVKIRRSRFFTSPPRAPLFGFHCLLSRLLWTELGQACACLYTFACMHASLCLYECVCVCVCMHACMCVYLCVEMLAYGMP